MSNVLDILAKAGYELHGTGDQLLPATLIHEDAPVGFLNADLSVSLISDREPLRPELEHAIDFAVENDGLPQIEGEYLITQFGQTTLTTDYDYEQQKPIYHVCSVDNEQNLTVMNAYEDRAEATHSYAELSGLLSGEPASAQRERGRVNRFLAVLKEQGYAIRDAVEDRNHLFEVFDSEDNLVGHINRNNRFTVTVDSSRQRKQLTDLYLSGSPGQPELPSFFSRLRDGLRGIGLSLKVMFSPSGRHYAIHDHHKEIASVAEDHSMTYTPLATDEQRARIDRLVTEIERDNAARTVPTPEPQIPRETIAADAPEPVPPLDAPSQHTPVLKPPATPSVQEIMELVNRMLESQVLYAAVRELVAPEQEPAASMPEHPSQEQTAIPAAGGEDIPPALSPERQAIVAEFMKLQEELNPVEGFDQDRYQQLLDAVHVQFGTTNQVEFLENLHAGKYDDKGKSLADKMNQARNSADRQNAFRKPEREEPNVQKERN